MTGETMRVDGREALLILPAIRSEIRRGT